VAALQVKAPIRKRFYSLARAHFDFNELSVAQA
jgi:hypothetical protein